MTSDYDLIERWSSPSSLGLIVLLLATGYLYRRLQYYRFEQYASWPQPPPSLLFGHLKVMHWALQQCPSRDCTDAAFIKIWELQGKPPAFVLDFRPFGPVLCIVCKYDLAEQCIRTTKDLPYGMHKSPTLALFADLIGKGSILTTDGEQWRELRKKFNSGFASSHLLRLLPVILDSTSRFTASLDQCVNSGEEFKLGDLCSSVTYDIIYPLTMGGGSTKSHQNEIRQLYQEIVETYRSVLETSVFADPRIKWRRRNLATKLDSLIKQDIEENFQPQSQDTRPGSIVALSLKDHQALTPEILQSTCDQVKTFLFAGQDTTSTTLQWAIYELSRTPGALQALRREHDEMFGPDSSPEDVRDMLVSQGASILSKMSYTSAVIKEALRLHPPGGTARQAAPGTEMYIQLPDGRNLRTDGLVAFNCLSIIHRDDDVYGENKDDFVPERWLHEAGNIPPGAWRPFERGPRGCIGQELANIEARVILACIVRRYDFSKIGIGATKYGSNGEPILNQKGQYDVVSEMYDIREVTFKPVDAMRMRVKFAGKTPAGVGVEHI